MLDPVRTWVMVGLTAFFVLLYAASLLGWLDPLPDSSVAMHLQPILFAIIGYYFGRVPGQENERNLKEQVASQHRENSDLRRRGEQMEREVAQAETRTAETQVRLQDVRRALSAGAPRAVRLPRAFHAGGGDRDDAGGHREDLSDVVAAALRILDED